jgi:hypothetical protein
MRKAGRNGWEGDQQTDRMDVVHMGVSWDTFEAIDHMSTIQTELRENERTQCVHTEMSFRWWWNRVLSSNSALHAP